MGFDLLPHFSGLRKHLNFVRAVGLGIIVLVLAAAVSAQTLPLQRPSRPARDPIGAPPPPPPPPPPPNNNPFTMDTLTVWGGMNGQPYTFAVQTSNGVLPVNWAITAGSLPPGLTLGATTGVIAGTPTTSGIYAFTVQATDLGARIASRSFTNIISDSDSNYGNVGDAYAGEAPPDPNAILLSACTNLSSNLSYRVIANVTAATPGTNCFTLAPGVRLDLGGRTVTGRITINNAASGIRLFNGTVNCNWVDDGGDAGCVKILSEGQSIAQMRIHHLTIANAAEFARALHIDWPMPNLATGYSIRVYNLSIVVPAQPTSLRCFAISMLIINHQVEVSNSDLECTGLASACQGVMCYTAGNCKIHHNRITMDFYTPNTGDVGRAMLFDGNTLNGEAWNNLITTNNHRAFRVRDSFNVRAHDNIFKSITAGPSAVAAIHFADPDAGATNDMNALVDNNTFEMAGGVVFFIRNGINVFVKNNKYTCVGCASSLLATVRSPIAPSTKSELIFENNIDVILYLPPIQVSVFSGATAFMCNSGVAGGLGTTVPIGPC